MSLLTCRCDHDDRGDVHRADEIGAAIVCAGAHRDLLLLNDYDYGGYSSLYRASGGRM